MRSRSKCKQYQEKFGVIQFYGFVLDIPFSLFDTVYQNKTLRTVSGA